MRDGAQQKVQCFFNSDSFIYQLQICVHLFMFLEKRIPLSDLLKAVFQRPEEQRVLSLGMHP